MRFEKVRLNEYGYYELKEKPEDCSDRNEWFEKEYSHQYYEFTEAEKVYFRNRMRKKEAICVQNLKKPLRECSLLDVSCGKGMVLGYFADKVAEITGTDISIEAMQYYHPQYLSHFIQGDCHEVLAGLIEENKKYDIINMDAALDMVDHPDDIAACVKKLLNPGGLFVVKVGNNYSDYQLMLLKTGKVTKEHWLDEKGHISYFNKDGLNRYLEAKGFVCLGNYAEGFNEFHLMNPLTNYYENPTLGRVCYASNVEFENMLYDISFEKTLQLNRLLGEMGLGREMIGVYRQNEE